MAGQVELFLIGDELLLGKRVDKHLPKVTALLKTRGMELAGVEILPDAEHTIAAAIKRIHGRGLPLLSCGGIGATPDDLTRQAAAQAFEVPIARHPEATRLIEQHYGEHAYPNRVLMADFPRGADLIPNPVNQVAGFWLHDCYFVPGFPEMAWPMLEWVLDGPLARLHRVDPPVEYSLRVSGVPGEGDLLEAMEGVLAAYPGIHVSSLPKRGSNSAHGWIDFGLRGPRGEAAAAYRWFRAAVARRGDAIIEDTAAPESEPV
ncbi:MAG TPA: competence/damage-inducible protein A [Nevskiaceae bacterium]|nr:competence/damage-inducible protein A [Nevskiaceae bacterium]